MTHGWLGDIMIGDTVWTGPVAAGEKRSAAIVQHKVSRGKQPLQDMGDDNDQKSLDFFWDETFCEPVEQLARLRAAFDARQPLPYVGGDGSFDGVRWLIEDIDVKTLKTTPYGRPVRMRVTLKMIEAPAESPLTFFARLATAAAAAIGSAASNVLARRAR